MLYIFKNRDSIFGYSCNQTLLLAKTSPNMLPLFLNTVLATKQWQWGINKRRWPRWSSIERLIFLTRNTEYIKTTTKLHIGPQKRTKLPRSPSSTTRGRSKDAGAGVDNFAGRGLQGHWRRVHPSGLTAQSAGWRWDSRACRGNTHQRS
jgi:hypothetical protein